MNIRKERVHNCGLTNLDYRTKGDIESIDRYHTTLKYADFGTMGKSQYKRLVSAENPLDQLKITGGFKTFTKPNPKVETTTDFYKTKNKNIKAP